MRQAIEKQLNKVEQSNRFAKAVFFDNSHELMVGTKEEQDIASSCKRLIQNAIICWNYMYMSQLILDAKTEKSRELQISITRQKMAIAWQHINFLGDYDFTNNREIITIFDGTKIRALKVS